MTTTTRERNFKKNPHTARWLRTFHDANGADYNRTDGPAADLLDEVPVKAPSYLPSTAQRALINKLTDELEGLDRQLATLAGNYTGRMDEHAAWTRENTSRWITNLIAKVKELRTASAPAQPVQVEDGRYAVEENGELKFFKVKNGRRPGFVFLDIQASDEWHKIANVTRIRAIVALIAADPKAAMTRYGQEIGECGRCGRTLTSEYRKLGLGPICIDK